MATMTAADIPLLITSDNASSERRISPSWTLAQLKGRLEPITGVPASCQRLLLKVASQTQQIEAADEDATILAQWPLQAYAEIVVGDSRTFLTVRHISNILYLAMPLWKKKSSLRGPASKQDRDVMFSARKYSIIASALRPETCGLPCQQLSCEQDTP